MKAACYVIDLDVKRPEVSFLDAEGLDLDFKFYKTQNIDDLSDNDRKYFRTEKEAEEFLSRYLKVLDSLDNARLCKDRSLPNMLYKRRYLVLSLLGLKSHTKRKYDKKWKAGQLFNLYDQTYFLTVKLKNVFKNTEGLYQYDFEI